MSNEQLIAQLRKAREFEVTVGHITFYGECPTYSKLMRIINSTEDDSADAVMAFKAVKNWIGATEADIIAGGDPGKELEFDRKLFEEVLFDRADWWKPISMEITKSVMARQMIKESEIKNLSAGTITKPLSE
jgi:hypothetical protein